MAHVIYLAPGEEMPDTGEDQSWLTVEASTDGKFFGTGAAWRSNGEWVGYVSLPEDDLSLEAALQAAQAWAENYAVPTIWVQLQP